MFEGWATIIDKITPIILGGFLVATLIVGRALIETVGSWALSVDQLIAIVASIASCAAAVATYLTVREMKAGRVASARARLTTPGTDLPIRFLWTSRSNTAPEIAVYKLIVRNASGGVAHNIRLRWAADFDIVPDDLVAVNRWLGETQSVSLREPHLVAFQNGTETSSHLVVSKDDASHLGDLGPNQETYTIIPSQILSLVYVKWLSLLTRVADGGSLNFDDVPLVKFRMVHDSPYESDVFDEHLVRFELLSHSVKDRRTKQLRTALGGHWSTFDISLAFEPTSRNMYEVPKVVVGGRYRNAG